MQGSCSSLKPSQSQIQELFMCRRFQDTLLLTFTSLKSGYIVAEWLSGWLLSQHSCHHLHAPTLEKHQTRGAWVA